MTSFVRALLGAALIPIGVQGLSAQARDTVPAYPLEGVTVTITRDETDRALAQRLHRKGVLPARGHLWLSGPPGRGLRATPSGRMAPPRERRR